MGHRNEPTDWPQALRDNGFADDQPIHLPCSVQQLFTRCRLAGRPRRRSPADRGRILRMFNESAWRWNFCGLSPDYLRADTCAA
jgi:hypothetical protein